MGLFEAADGWGDAGVDKKAPLPKIYIIYLKIMKLGTVIPYLKEIRKSHESLDTLFEFC